MNFKVGDRVICLNDWGGSPRMRAGRNVIVKGKEYTITKIRPNYFNASLIVIELDGKILDDPDAYIRANLTSLEKLIYGV